MKEWTMSDMPNPNPNPNTNEGVDHIWQAALHNRVSSGTGCPCCAGKKACSTNCFAARKPASSKQWHPIKNGEIGPQDVVAGSTRTYWFKKKDGTEYLSRLCDFKEGR